VKSNDVLVGIDRCDHLVRIDLRGQGKLDQNAMHCGSLLSRAINASSSASLAIPASRWSNDHMPASTIVFFFELT
jgi:hypothetical protein